MVEMKERIFPQTVGSLGKDTIWQLAANAEGEVFPPHKETLCPHCVKGDRPNQYFVPFVVRVNIDGEMMYSFLCAECIADAVQKAKEEMGLI